MKALDYHGPGQRSWDTVPDPAKVVLEVQPVSTELVVLEGATVGA
jgi:hypothetical protein